MLSKLKWLAAGALSGLAFALYWTFGRSRPAPAQKKEVEAAVERAKAEAIKAEPVPTDINEVKKKLRQKGLIN